MEALKKLKCALNSRVSLKDYYKSLSKEELQKRKPHQRNVLLGLITTWGISWFLIVQSTKMDMPLFILFSGTVIGTIISLWVDYRNKIRMIDELLRSK